jgi:hypothetical protein
VLARKPKHGTVKLAANGSFVYKPKANFKGTDSFTYEVRSGSVTSNVATVTLTVSAPPKKKKTHAKLKLAGGSARPSAAIHAAVDEALAHLADDE